ncbi:MAG: EAL domain-containing protein [Burkholderiaceae bacterium]
MLQEEENDGGEEIAPASRDAGSSNVTRFLEDVTTWMKLPSRLKPEDDFVRYALDSAAIVATTDVRGTITYVNSKFCEISGYSEAELMGSNHRMLKSGEHDTRFFRDMYREIAAGRVWHGEICNRRKDGSFYWVYTTIVPHVSVHRKIDSYTAIRFDITGRKSLEDQLRASKENMRRIANIDPQTGLPNRRRFQDYISSLVARYGPVDREFHLALLDVDMFKEINDSFGHPAGDLLLGTVANRLQALAEPRMLISRLGGDEFGLIFAEGSAAQARAFLERALEAIRSPIPIAGTARRCSASLGLASFPRHGRDAASLFKAADLALYHAKALGRDRIESFKPALLQFAEQKAALLAEIEDGLHRQEFELHYQPIIGLGPQDRISLEALMRWRHPQRGLLSPSAFQEGFSDHQVRAALGMYMLERVFRDVTRFLADGLSLGLIAINLTNSDFRSDSFLDRFFELSAQSGIPPTRFCVEVTEGMLLGRSQKRVHLGLRRLHRAGVEVALDDFGTGFASLTHLRQLPIDRLKIDRSFTANMASSREDQAIVRGVIEIAHSLGAHVTAEGIETIEQIELLAGMKCDMFQGWYFAKACAPDRLAPLLDRIPQISIPAGPPPEQAGAGLNADEMPSAARCLLHCQQVDTRGCPTGISRDFQRAP